LSFLFSLKRMDNQRKNKFEGQYRWNTQY
jgi:hypothetical protein